jgi:hypothetical protein
MANQVHVCHSSLVSSAALFAGGPFYCAQSNVLFAEGRCMRATTDIPLDELIALTYAGGAVGTVDDPKNLVDDKVYLFSGYLDTVVDPAVMLSLETFYSEFLSDASSQIHSRFDVAAEHCFPTLDYAEGEPCAVKASPYIGTGCAISGAEDALSWIIDDFDGTVEMSTPSYLYAFDQLPFIPFPYTPLTSSLDRTGYVYIPPQCQDGSTQCNLHISFHGCEQNLGTIGPQYANSTGLNDHAAANDLVILYPYADVSSVVNPKGCWDWFGYTGPDYGLKTGVQMAFVENLIRELTGAKRFGGSEEEGVGGSSV